MCGGGGLKGKTHAGDIVNDNIRMTANYKATERGHIDILKL